MKKAWNKIVYWGGFPFVIILAPILGRLLDVGASVQIVAIFPSFIMLKVFGEKDNSRWHLCLGVVTSTIAIILWKANVSTNPWSPLGWVIVIALTIFIWVGSSTKKKGSFGDALDDPTTWTNLVGIIALVTVLTGLYLFFLSQMIWLVITFAGITHLLFYENEEGVSKEYLEDNGYLFTFFFIAIGLVSTLIQFWASLSALIFIDTFPGTPLWFLLLSALAAVGIPIALKKSKKVLRRKRAEKETKARIQKQEEEAQKKKEQEKKQVMDTFTEKLKNPSKIVWKDIFDMITFHGKQSIDPTIIVDTPLIPSLIKVSEIKKQVVYNNQQLNQTLDLIDSAMNTLNDMLMVKAIRQLNALTQYRDYRGYDALWSQIRDRLSPENFELVKKENNS